MAEDYEWRILEIQDQLAELEEKIEDMTEKVEFGRKAGLATDAIEEAIKDNTEAVTALRVLLETIRRAKGDMSAPLWSIADNMGSH